MAKTKQTEASVDDFLDAIEDDQIRDDTRTIARIMRQATNAAPKMWSNIIGFGTYRMTYANGKAGEWPIVALAPRNKKLTLYIKPEFTGRPALLKQLGKHSIGQSCLHIRRLADVDVPTLKKLVTASVKATLARP